MQALRAMWRDMRWFERVLVVLGVITIWSNAIAAFVPPHEWWRLLVCAAWLVAVPYVFLVVSYRALVDEAQALTRDLLAELQQRDEWRRS